MIFVKKSLLRLFLNKTLLIEKKTMCFFCSESVFRCFLTTLNGFSKSYQDSFFNVYGVLCAEKRERYISRQSVSFFFNEL